MKSNMIVEEKYNSFYKYLDSLCSISREGDNLRVNVQKIFKKGLEGENINIKSDTLHTARDIQDGCSLLFKLVILLRNNLNSSTDVDIDKWVSLLTLSRQLCITYINIIFISDIERNLFKILNSVVAANDGIFHEECRAVDFKLTTKISNYKPAKYNDSLKSKDFKLNINTELATIKEILPIRESYDIKHDFMPSVYDTQENLANTLFSNKSNKLLKITLERLNSLIKPVHSNKKNFRAPVNLMCTARELIYFLFDYIPSISLHSSSKITPFSIKMYYRGFLDCGDLVINTIINNILLLDHSVVYDFCYKTFIVKLPNNGRFLSMPRGDSDSSMELGPIYFTKNLISIDNSLLSDANIYSCNNSTEYSEYIGIISEHMNGFLFKDIVMDVNRTAVIKNIMSNLVNLNEDIRYNHILDRRPKGISINIGNMNCTDMFILLIKELQNISNTKYINNRIKALLITRTYKLPKDGTSIVNTEKAIISDFSSSSLKNLKLYKDWLYIHKILQNKMKIIKNKHLEVEKSNISIREYEDAIKKLRDRIKLLRCSYRELSKEINSSNIKLNSAREKHLIEKNEELNLYKEYKNYAYRQQRFEDASNSDVNAITGK